MLQHVQRPAFMHVACQAWWEAISRMFRKALQSSRPVYVAPSVEARQVLTRRIGLGCDSALLRSLHTLVSAAVSVSTSLWHSASVPLRIYFMHSVTSRSMLADSLPRNRSHLEVFVTF